MKPPHCHNIASNDISLSFKTLHTAVKMTQTVITYYHDIRFH
jgi:hypothetical protein